MARYDEAIYPKISLLILAKNDEFALKRTVLSALEQNYHDYELFIAFSDCPECQWISPEKQGVDMRCFSFGKIPNNALLATALTHLRGTYVQILFPGFTYLSPHALHDVMHAALQQQFPSLLYTATLAQKKEKPYPTLFYYPLSLETLRIGQVPTELACCWIRRDLFERLGEWVPTRQEDYAWSFFSQLSKLEGLHAHGIKRVFIEHQTPFPSIGLWHACKRILKGFGPLQTVRYLWSKLT